MASMSSKPRKFLSTRYKRLSLNSSGWSATSRTIRVCSPTSLASSCAPRTAPSGAGGGDDGPDLGERGTVVGGAGGAERGPALLVVRGSDLQPVHGAHLKTMPAGARGVGVDDRAGHTPEQLPHRLLTQAPPPGGDHGRPPAGFYSGFALVWSAAGARSADSVVR